MADVTPDRLAALERALDYVSVMTYCGADAEWHFKPNYDPQVVLDALALPPSDAGGWLPIDEAAHNGEDWLLGRAGDSQMMVGYWDGDDPDWPWKDIEGDGYTESRWNRYRPLPAPPEEPHNG